MNKYLFSATNKTDYLNSKSISNIQNPVSNIFGDNISSLSNSSEYGGTRKVHTPIGSINSHRYDDVEVETSRNDISADSMIEIVANWFLSKSSMSNKKLQKLCYYAYCWYIVFNNDIEALSLNSKRTINTLFSETFQAWIHGPVSPILYHKYKTFGWRDIPYKSTNARISQDVVQLLEQVWDAYGNFSGDELELISHNEQPWIKARGNCTSSEACYNEISKKDILEYYSSLC